MPIKRILHALALAGMLPCMADASGIFAASDSGLYYQTASDSPWTHIALDSAGPIRFIAHEGNRIVAVGPKIQDQYHYDQPFISSNGGATWQRNTLPLMEVFEVIFGDSDIVLLSAGGWYSLGGSALRPARPQYMDDLESLTLGFQAGNTVLMGGWRGEYALSLNHGHTWTKLPHRALKPWATCLFSRGKMIWSGGVIGYASRDSISHIWKDRQIVGTAGVSTFAGHGSRIFAGTDSGAYFTDDMGANWKRIASLPAKDTHGFQFSGDSGFVISDGNKLVTVDGGLTWKRIAAALPGKPSSVAAFAAMPASEGVPLDTGKGDTAAGDFAPIKAGYSWTYLCRDTSHFAGGIFVNELSIRTMLVDSAIAEAGGMRYHVRMRDSILTYQTHVYNPKSMYGKPRETGLTVHETADGNLSVVLEDSAFFSEFEFARYTEWQSVFFSAAFNRHRYSRFSVSDTSPDRSHPQVADSWRGQLAQYETRTESDIGLTSYAQSFQASKEGGRTTYDLIGYHGLKEVVALPAAARSSRPARTRLLHFDGRAIRIEGRRPDGRLSH